MPITLSQPPNPKSIIICFILPKTRKAVKHLTSVWRNPLHQMAVFVGLDDQGRLCLQPYGFLWASGLKAELVSQLLLSLLLFSTVTLPLVLNLELGLTEPETFTWPSRHLFISQIYIQRCKSVKCLGRFMGLEAVTTLDLFTKRITGKIRFYIKGSGFTLNW